GWTVYTRFDTALDLAVPALVIAAPLMLMPLWRRLGRTLAEALPRASIGAWVLFVIGGAVSIYGVTRFPLAIWDPENFTASPATFSLAIDLGQLKPLAEGAFNGPVIVAVLAVLAGGSLLGLAVSALRPAAGDVPALLTKNWAAFGGLLATALVLFASKSSINEWVFGISTTWRFFLAMIMAAAVGAAFGALLEVVLIRPLYDRPIYQLMLTLGVGFILIEVAREVWGRTDFNMPRPAAFNGVGESCPGQGVGGLFSGCATVELFGSRIRIYNEVLVVIVGILVLIAVTMLLRRTRIGMIIRAGVQDAEMVEALGINVRRVFTQVFALGSALAALGGVLAAPSLGLSPTMGALLLLSALIALAIGGLTSFPGAAAGALLVGLLQQTIIRLGQTGMNLPFLDEPFKPSPTVVPAAAVMLMVIILLVLPSGLFGRSER
ncbi:MAG: branched-chain amino acid ABC transporter permease, partial [bacterium]|nr:branched-chain amino acid ABC transporter permease [bacterium]